MHYHVGTAAVTEVSLGTDFRTAVKPNTSYKITLQAKTSAETSAEAKIWLNLGECFATPTWGDIYNDVQKGNILTGPQAISGSIISLLLRSPARRMRWIPQKMQRLIPSTQQLQRSTRTLIHTGTGRWYRRQK